MSWMKADQADLLLVLVLSLLFSTIKLLFRLSPIPLSFEIKVQVECVSVIHTLIAFLVTILPLSVENPKRQILHHTFKSVQILLS